MRRGILTHTDTSTHLGRGRIKKKIWERCGEEEEKKGERPGERERVLRGGSELQELKRKRWNYHCHCHRNRHRAEVFLLLLSLHHCRCLGHERGDPAKRPPAFGVGSHSWVAVLADRGALDIGYSLNRGLLKVNIVVGWWCMVRSCCVDDL